MTKQKMADLIGVPGDDLSTDLTNPLNDGNKRRSSGGNSGIKERDVRDVQQIKG